jgi:aryl-alcohol dehydrogenase-like predicted oxidoreductase
MKYSSIPYVKKPVSRLVLGTAIREMENKQTAYKLLDSIYELGVTTFDTAVQYGEMESIFGGWVNARNLRDNVVIISKGAHPNQWRNRVTPYDILSDVHDSLAKLGTSYIDIYLLHRDDRNVPVGPIIEVLNQLHHEGKIGAFGGSNWTFERIKEANSYAQNHSLIPFTVSSPNFGLAEQVNDPWGGGCVSISGPNNTEARKWYVEENMPLFSYSSLARGLLSGKLKSSDHAKAAEVFDQPTVIGYCHPQNFKRLERVEILALQKGYSVAQISLAWLMNQELNTFALVSCENAELMKNNIEAFDIKLTQDELLWLDLLDNETIHP